MTLTGEHTLPVTPTQAWAALHDVEVMQAAIPGCQSLTPAGANAYDAVMSVSFGPLGAMFEGRLKLTRLVPPDSFRVGFQGGGGLAGAGKGHVQVRLTAAAPRQTLLHYTLTAQVSGDLVGLGGFLVQLAARQLADEFFERLQAQLLKRHPPRRTRASRAA